MPSPSAGVGVTLSGASSPGPRPRRRLAAGLFVLLALAASMPSGVILGADPTPAGSSVPAPSGLPPVDDDQPVQPDIIIVMVDDLAFLEDDAILRRLPNIDRLFRRQGLRFMRAYNEVPLCCPARANFHSGQHTLKNGVTANHPRRFDHSRTFAAALDTVGYQTHLVGKYMNNYDGSVVPPGWDRFSVSRDFSLVRPQQWHNGRIESFPGSFFDDVVRRRSVAWLRQANVSAPVLQFVSPYAPHRHPQRCRRDASLRCQLQPAVMPRDRGAAACRGVGHFRPPSYTTSTRRDPTPFRVPALWRKGWPLLRSCESLLVVDRTVAQLRAAQRERDRPAYWVFLSDNGMSWGQHGFPLKHVPWATPLPLYLHGPGIDPGVTDAAVSIIDIPVTLAELAGAQMPWADGRSFVPVLDGRETFHRSEILEHMPAPPDNGIWDYRAWQGIRTDRWRYIRWDQGRRELYDIVADPGETRDLSRAEPDVIAELDARLDELLEASRA